MVINMSEENSFVGYELITQERYQEMLVDLIETQKKKINKLQNSIKRKGYLREGNPENYSNLIILFSEESDLCRCYDEITVNASLYLLDLMSGKDDYVYMLLNDSEVFKMSNDVFNLIKDYSNFDIKAYVHGLETIGTEVDFNEYDPKFIKPMGKEDLIAYL